MSYSENLKKSPLAFDTITELHITDTKIQDIGSWVKEFSHLGRLVLYGCKNVVSLPYLPGIEISMRSNNYEKYKNKERSRRIWKFEEE